MMAMQFALAERKDERPLLLIYANKSWEDVTYREELEALKKKLDLTIVHVLREPPEDWTGETGYVLKWRQPCTTLGCLSLTSTWNTTTLFNSNKGICVTASCFKW